MTVLQVTRIAPQQQRAFQVSTDNASIAYALQNAMMAVGLDAQLKTVSGLNVPHLLQLTITQPSLPDQHAWPGDWILVTDAAYDDTENKWTVTPTTQAIVYGIGIGQAGSAADFVNTFTGECDLEWAATTAAPTATAESGLTATLTFPAPTSACGPYAYTAEGPGTVGEFATAPDGTVTAQVTGLTAAAECAWKVTVNTQYPGTTATSVESNTVTAFDQPPQQ